MKLMRKSSRFLPSIKFNLIFIKENLPLISNTTTDYSVRYNILSIKKQVFEIGRELIISSCLILTDFKAFFSILLLVEFFILL